MFLEIKDLALFIKLGWESAERSAPQEVRISIRLIFSGVPQAAFSDELGDTVCYAELCTRIQKEIEPESFKTIEHLHQFLEDRIAGFLPNNMPFSLRVHKLRPPVPGLLGGVIYGRDEAFRG